MDNPIDTVTALVEKEIEKIIDSGYLNKIVMGYNGLPTTKYIDTIERHRFLVDLSTKLQVFRTGTY